MSGIRSHTSGPGDRRGSRRYEIPLRMEIWPPWTARGADSQFVTTRNISIRGVYFFSLEERAPGSRLNFSLMFHSEFSGVEADLMAGVARILRSERLAVDWPAPYGVAVEIEQTTHTHGE